MDRFRTDIAAEAAPFSIGHSDRLLLAGSCFTEHIGGRLQALKFGVRVNPFGIVYNPASIADCLERLRAGKDESGKGCSYREQQPHLVSPVLCKVAKVKCYELMCHLVQ